MEGLPEYTYVSVSGHSKGGNLAQYLAIMSDKVDHCVSVDGLGFSMEFMARHGSRIEANVHKIMAYAADLDYVNALFLPLPLPPGHKVYVESRFNNIQNFMLYHCPNNFLTVDGRIGNAAAPTLITELVSALSIFINSSMQDGNRRGIADLQAA